MDKGSGNINSYKGTAGKADASKRIDKNAEMLSSNTLHHIAVGEYNTVNRPVSGGHGQESIEYMEKHNIPYEINVVYENGVRSGNLPTSTQKMKKTGNLQTWFPETWTTEDIAKAVLEVALSYQGVPKNHEYYTREVSGVSVTIIFGENGRIRAAFPSQKQPGGIKNDR